MGGHQNQYHLKWQMYGSYSLLKQRLMLRGEGCAGWQGCTAAGRCSGKYQPAAPIQALSGSPVASGVQAAG